MYGILFWPSWYSIAIKRLTYSFNTKFVPAIAICLGLILVAPMPSHAQQQTGQVVPGTRNPQTNETELFKHKTGLQSTGSQQVLNQGGDINIPQGKPASPNADDARKKESSPWPILVGLVVVGAIGGTIWLSRFSQVPEVQTANVAKEPEPAIAPEPISKTKKKPNKGKTRKKRKQR